MIDITKNNEAYWDKKIQIELSLKELQTIYDCVEVAKFSELEKIGKTHNYSWSNVTLSHEIHEYLYDMLSNYGGIIDIDED